MVSGIVFILTMDMRGRDAAELSRGCDVEGHKRRRSSIDVFLLVRHLCDFDETHQP